MKLQFENVDGDSFYTQFATLVIENLAQIDPALIDYSGDEVADGKAFFVAIPFAGRYVCCAFVGEKDAVSRMNLARVEYFSKMPLFSLIEKVVKFQAQFDKAAKVAMDHEDELPEFEIVLIRPMAERN